MSATITAQANKYVVYGDVVNSFQADPFTGDLLLVYNDQCVKQSIINIVRTMFYSRPYQPSVGSSIYSSLFDPADLFATTRAQNTIKEAIENYEKRAHIQSVNATIIEPQGMSVTVIFYTMTSSVAQSVTISVNRVR